ncbi:MAG TPA: hypothetical protein VL200_06250 [Lacunisphaera sp.]|nr:hypothetical protein [Lacunisphaera sp.]
MDHKVAEAEFFLNMMWGRNSEHPQIDFLLSAYVSAARSITFALKAVLRETPGFAEWYAVREGQLRANALAKYFLELRNVMQKTGAMVVNRSASRDQLARILTRQLSGQRRTWFGESGEKGLPPAPDMEVPAAALQHFRTLLEIVYDCYVDFGPLIDPQQYYTPEHFSKIGRTIEDAEEALGYPRGWTSLGKRDTLEYIAHRFEMLRRHAAGTGGLNEIFARHLGRTTPAPAPLPPLDLPEEGWSDLPSGGRVYIPKELRKTGSAEGDIAAYIASLKTGRPEPEQIAEDSSPVKSEDFLALQKLIFSAVRKIPHTCFEVAVAGTDEPVIRERVFCYEFYHQLRVLATETGFAYSIGPELDKGGHPIIRGDVIPDFVVHQPGDMGLNLCVVEVKPLSGDADGFDKDFRTLRDFVQNYRYYRGVLLAFGNSPRAEQVIMRKTGAIRELRRIGVHVWWVRRAGEEPVELL